MSRRLIVIATGSPRPDPTLVHMDASLKLRSIRHHVDLAAEQKAWSPSQDRPDHHEAVLPDGTRATVRIHRPDTLRDWPSLHVDLVAADGRSLPCISLKGRGPLQDHVPRDAAGLADAIVRMGQACVTTLGTAPAIDGRFPFGEAMRGCALAAMDRLPAHQAANVFMAGANCATPWSDASCEISLDDGGIVRTDCPRLQATTRLVTLHFGRNVLVIDSASMTATRHEDPMERLRLLALLERMPVVDAGDPYAPDRPDA